MTLPADISEEINRQFSTQPDRAQVERRLLSLWATRLNVGAEQLARAILILANGDIAIIDEIFDTNFHGDPRDLLMAANDVDASSRFGLAPFRND